MKSFLNLTIHKNINKNRKKFWFLLCIDEKYKFAKSFIAFFVYTIFLLCNSNYISAGELEKLIDKKWLLTEIKYGNMDNENISQKDYFIIVHYNFEMTYRLDSNPGKIKIESMANNILQYKYLKSDEQTYNGKVAEKIYQLLIKAQNYYLNDDTLDIISDFGYLRFKSNPQKDSGFTGTWILTGYFNTEAESQIKISEKLKRPIKLHFFDDGLEGMIEGHTELNDVRGKFEIVDTSHIKFNKINTPSKPEKNEWNEKFWEVIKFTSFFIAKRDVLFLYYNEDKEYMEFQIEEDLQ